jgi:hypothetical protein
LSSKFVDPGKLTDGPELTRFKFFGYHFSGIGLRVAKATIERFVERAFRLKVHAAG